MKPSGGCGTAIVVGLLGGIGSGKSTVASILRSRGAGVVDADEMAHEVLNEPEVREGIQAVFSRDVLDPSGLVDRGRLAELAFSSREGLEVVTRLVHPRVRPRILTAIAGFRRSSMGSDGPRPASRFLVLDVPLLAEGGLIAECDEVIFVHAPEGARAERCRRQRGWGPSELERRERYQMPPSEKRALCGWEIDNGGSLAETERATDAVLSALLGRAPEGREAAGPSDGNASTKE